MSSRLLQRESVTGTVAPRLIVLTLLSYWSLGVMADRDWSVDAGTIFFGAIGLASLGAASRDTWILVRTPPEPGRSVAVSVAGCVVMTLLCLGPVSSGIFEVWMVPAIATGAVLLLVAIRGIWDRRSRDKTSS